MIVYNYRTNLHKVIDMSLNPYYLNQIYEFYTNHKDYWIFIDGEIEK